MRQEPKHRSSADVLHSMHFWVVVDVLVLVVNVVVVVVVVVGG